MSTELRNAVLRIFQLVDWKIQPLLIFLSADVNSLLLLVRELAVDLLCDLELKGEGYDVR